MGEPRECGIPENRLADREGRAYHRSAVVIRGEPCPTHVRVGAAAVALAALALVLPAPAAADPFADGPALSQRPRTIKAVQRKLAELGFLARSGVDGVFGAQSRGAVIAFQKWEGLVRDGIPGPITQRALADAKRPEPLTRGRGTRVEIDLDLESVVIPGRHGAPVALLVSESVCNALRHAYPEGRNGRVRVGLRRTAGGFEIEVADEGVGLDPAAPNTGFGLTVAQLMCQQLKGRMETVAAQPGVRITVSVPMDSQAPRA